MRPARRAFGLALGRRLPTYDGDQQVPGLRDQIVIRRDRWAVPHVEASSEADAWFGLGFCQGQDRAFQLEGLVRVVRGTLAALVGSDAVPVDRVSRRVGLRRTADRDLHVLDDDVVEAMAAFAGGIDAGIRTGLPKRPHELVLLRGQPTTWDAADVLGVARLMAFLLAANWDRELARLMVLRNDGVEALAALDSIGAPRLPAAIPPGVEVGAAADRVADDLARFVATVGLGGGSNNWAIAPERSATGRPLLANDPHLAPTLPTHFYLAHLRCPEWEAAGAALVGSHGIYAGHNAHAAWGVTAAMVDNTDLAVEELGTDGRSVRRGEAFVPCEVVRELIEVAGGPPVVEEVLLTPEGPMIGPALEGEVGAISLRATWLEPRPVRGLLDLVRCETVADFHTRLADFPSASMHVAFATIDGHIGSQVVGEPPRRRVGWGAFPVVGSDPEAGWDEIVPFSEMPRQVDPAEGWLATANGPPTPAGVGPFLSVDFATGYRVARIGERLASRRDWDLPAMADLQRDVTSIPWRELRGLVLSAATSTPAGVRAQELLATWDGRVAPESSSATVFEHLMAELRERVAVATAPNSADWVLGRGFSPLAPAGEPLVGGGPLVALLQDQPEGWFPVGWPAVVGNAIDAVAARLLPADGQGGPPPWGRARPVRFRHPLGRRRPFERVFDLGPVPLGGDSDTPAQAAVGGDPTAEPSFAPALRMVLDVGAWERGRWALPGGQCGNPCSAHYDDQLPAWTTGEGIPIPWTDGEVELATVHELVLRPEEGS